MAFTLNSNWNTDESDFLTADTLASVAMDSGLTRKKSAIEKYFGFDNKGTSPFRGSKGNYAAIFGLTILPRSDVFSYDGGRLKIPFQYLTEGVPSLSKTANYDDTNIPGRFEGLASYTYSNTTDFQLDLTYVAETKQSKSEMKKVTTVEQFQTEIIREKTNSNKKNNTWSLEYINSLIPLYESLAYPQYDDGFNPPNLCLLNIGAIYIDLPILIKTVSVTHKAPYDIKTMMPRIIQVTLDVRISFPLYQAISSRAIIDKSVSVLPRSVYMRKTITSGRYKRL